MKVGFTLIEVLAVVIIIGVISFMVLPVTLSLIDRSKTKVYDNQINEIKNAAKMYVAENSTTTEDLKIVGIDHIITLKTISELGYIDLPIVNSLTGENFNAACFEIIITKQTNGSYKYILNPQLSC